MDPFEASAQQFHVPYSELVTSSRGTEGAKGSRRHCDGIVAGSPQSLPPAVGVGHKLHEHDLSDRSVRKGDPGGFDVKVEQLMTRQAKVCTDSETLNRATRADVGV